MINVTDSQVNRAIEALQHIPNAVPKALSAAINRAAEGARTEAVKKVKEEYVITASRVRETIHIFKANPANLTAAITSRGRLRALSYFKTNPSKPLTRRITRQLIAHVKRTGGETISGAFIAKTRSGHVGVFNRVGKARLPVVQRYGPSVPQMMGEPRVSSHIEQESKRRLDDRIEHEISRILRGVGL
jgi:hypothetical protein